MLRHKIVLGSIVCLFAAEWVGQTLSQTQRPRQATSRPDSRQSQQLTAEQRRKEFEKRVAAENKERMAERRKEFEQQARDRVNGKDERRNESIKQTLEMTEEQWKVIEPKVNKVYFLKDQAGINIAIGGTGGYRVGGGGGSGGSSSGGASSTSTGTGSAWKTQSSSGGGASYGGGAGSGAGANTGTDPPGAGKDGGWKVQNSGGGAGGIMAGGFNGPLWRLADRELTEGEKTCEELLALLGDENSKQEDIEQKIDALRRARENAAKELAKARQELREVLTVRQQARLVLAGLLD
jgi:outer membrane murein-binding lipoprotein Lpp